MTDETQIPEWARDAGVVTIVVGAVAAAVRAIVGGVVRLRRGASADLKGTAQLLRAILEEERAQMRLERADHSREIEECQAARREQDEAIRGFAARVDALELQLSAERAERAREVSDLRQTIDRLERRESTPPGPGEEK